MWFINASTLFADNESEMKLFSIFFFFSGVTTPEILAAHILMQFFLTMIQMTLVLIVTFLGFQLPCKGNFLGVIILMVMMGFCGMCYGNIYKDNICQTWNNVHTFLIIQICPGFCISIMVSSHTVANYVSTGTFYPLILLSGKCDYGKHLWTDMGSFHPSFQVHL